MISLTGCGTLVRHPVPAPAASSATLPHLPDVRAWAGKPGALMEQDLARSFAQASHRDFPPAADGKIRYARLAPSGGGANGAFGAGYRSAAAGARWSTRPPGLGAKALP